MVKEDEDEEKVLVGGGDKSDEDNKAEGKEDGLGGEGGVRKGQDGGTI